MILLLTVLLCGCQQKLNAADTSEAIDTAAPLEGAAGALDAENGTDAVIEAPKAVEIVIAETPEPQGTAAGRDEAAAPETDGVADGTAAVPLEKPIFVPSENFPLPDQAHPLHRGRPYTVGGTIESPVPMKAVRAVIIKEGQELLSCSVEFAEEDQVTAYDLVDLTYSKDVTCLAEEINFKKLHVGDHTLKLYADTFDGTETEVVSADFTVIGGKWIQLLPNNLRGNYDAALAFFGDDANFLFRFKLNGGGTNNITVDPEWWDQYADWAAVTDGSKWKVNKLAVPYFETAGQYLENTYIRVHGTNGDTGALQLSKLVEYNGSMMARFVNSGLYLSHHTFGTAVDINAYVSPNRDVFANREWIYEDVTENLAYNGIAETDGVKCYDFTYSGSEHCEKYDVPDTALNYLIYELAFYRAGFSWGVYYPHTSDAMHFSLTELSPELFESGPYAMRKVFEYIWEPSDAEPTEAPIEQ